STEGTRQYNKISITHLCRTSKCKSEATYELSGMTSVRVERVTPLKLPSNIVGISHCSSRYCTDNDLLNRFVYLVRSN
ncbi:hypothetical protein ACHAW6_013759, partial [Cyclotella cf. meneghiniana]